MFKKLNDLYHISLYNERIAKVSNSAKRCILRNLETLDLSYNYLTKFDMGMLVCLGQLKKLELNDNKISVFENSAPDGACHWPNLQILRLSSNRLKQFDPKYFSCSTNLVKLWLRSNMLTSFGQGATCYWPNLESLWVYNNELTYFNEKMLNCSFKLEDLRLSRNKLTSFEWIGPEEKCVMGRLQILDLSENQMTELDFEQFNCAKGLRAVYLDNNRLTSMEISLNKTMYPTMYRFDITVNRWRCENLQNIVDNLKTMNFNYECDKSCTGRSIDGICCYG
jgi:Leucine-rich repeat (LRR) protein